MLIIMTGMVTLSNKIKNNENLTCLSFIFPLVNIECSLRYLPCNKYQHYLTESSTKSCIQWFIKLNDRTYVL